MAARNTTTLLVDAALRGYLGPRLAADAGFNMAPVIRGLNAKNWKASKELVADRIRAQANGKLAADASLEDVTDFLDNLDDVVAEEPIAAMKDAVEEAEGDEPETTEDADAGSNDEVLAKLKDLLPEDVFSQVEAALKGTEKTEEAEPTTAETQPDPDPAEDQKGKPPMVTKSAMDAALARVAKDTEARTIARLRAVSDAREAVAPFVGTVNVAAMDSADDVYKFALDQAGVDLKDVPAAAFPAMVKLLRKPGSEAAPRPKHANDAASASSFDKMFPNANRLA